MSNNQAPAPLDRRTPSGKKPSEWTIAMLGMGKMGGPMARNLLGSGFGLTVWSRTTAHAHALAASGANVADTATGAVEGANVVISMVTGGPAVESILFDRGVAAAIPLDAAFIDMSSIPPHSAAENATKLSDLGIHWLDAPVSGGTRGAESGSLTIFVGGEAEVFASCAPIFGVLGRATYMGPAGSGQIAKLANQIIVAATIGGVAEALMLVVRAGLNPEVVRSALSGGFADSRILEEHGRRMIDRDFDPGGSVELQLKDLDTALSEAIKLGLDLPLTSSVTALYRNLADAGHLGADHSALLLELERRNTPFSAVEVE